MRGAYVRRMGFDQALAIGVLTGLVATAALVAVAVVLPPQSPPPQPPLSAPQDLPSSTRGPVGMAGLAALPTVGSAAKTSAPTLLSIPSIGVSSALLQVGQTTAGSLQVPTPGPDYDRAAWYRYSPSPGSLGPAVIVGHVDSSGGGPSVFFRLGGLKPRDTVSVTRADGSIADFVVDGVRRFRKADFPTALVYGNTSNAALRLITCGGPFDASVGHYRDNVIVLASLVGIRVAG